MNISDYCKEHKCNSECLFRHVCSFYLYGGLSPSDMTYAEATEITKDIINLGKVLQEVYND